MKTLKNIKSSLKIKMLTMNGAFNIVRKHVPAAFDGLDRKHFLQSPKKIIIVKGKAKLKASA
ncbi:hypothetical protein BACCIP111895_01937 [Neobacillus rhizosphaerae]|uniref:Uncharacterized protein n=1 Tax=Neobacillus rhizosphaerae TaxID=2880965 RepID=A0ABM9EQ69_9BACI|nr:hypothetical protein [Neobacillus rhizosphaerae]CAH2714761.1 hypothetical protein BACCIP111895_01937 [Neobacillus rhizosphaerae]